MLDRDFFEHFSHINVSKPIDPHWFVRRFTFKPQPNKEITKSSLDKHKNFVFQLIQKVPDGKKARVRILAEKRNTDYSKLRMKGSFLYVFAGKNGGKKLQGCDKYKFDYNILCLSIPVKDVSDIVTFVVVHQVPEQIEAKCYVNVFCEYDFILYDIDHPEKIFESGERSGAVLDNFSITDPSSALVLKRTIINWNEFMCLKDSTTKNIGDGTVIERRRAAKYEIVAKNLINESKMARYSFRGGQIDQKKYIFNKEEIGLGSTSIVYSVTEKETGEERAAVVSRKSMDIVSKSFSQKVAIMRMLKYPSIIGFIGFSETNFSYQPEPMIITELCPNKTLKDQLPKMSNTQKMINLIGIAFGMNYIHKHNIILRDLRCSSVLLDQNMHPKIGHFNSARIASHDMEYFGTDAPLYCVAPELIEGPAPYSFSADVHAYGMLLYHVVVNNVEPTIEHANKFSFLMNLTDGKLPELEGVVPQKFHSFIREMWNADAAQRPTFEEIIKKLLNERDTFWLENVDEDEVERYIHQFGASLKTRNHDEYIDIIQRINIIKNSHEIRSSKDLFNQVGIALKSMATSSAFNSVKCMKESSLSGCRDAIAELASILCRSAPNDESLGIGIELANIAADLDSTEAFALLGSLYVCGRGVRRNATMAAANFKVAADRGDSESMLAYAKILMNFVDGAIGYNERNQMLAEAREIVSELDGKNSSFYVESRLAFDTIENAEASLFVAKKYFEKAKIKGSSESESELKNINEKYEDIISPPQYFEELYQDIKE